jgi:hypothetical protein
VRRFIVTFPYTPVILVTQEVEIRKIMVQGPISTNKNWARWCDPVISATWEA